MLIIPNNLALRDEINNKRKQASWLANLSIYNIVQSSRFTLYIFV